MDAGLVRASRCLFVQSKEIGCLLFTACLSLQYVPVSCCRMDHDDDFKTAMPENNAVCQLEAAAYSPGHDTTSQLFTKVLTY